MTTVGVNVPIELKFYQYFIFYNFETWLKPYLNDKINSKLQFNGTHNLMSIIVVGSEEKKGLHTYNYDHLLIQL